MDRILAHFIRESLVGALSSVSLGWSSLQMACFNTFLGCEASKVISGGHSQVNPAYIINNYLYYFIVILINIIGILHDRMLSYDKIHWK